jgi:hypothetical protein
MSSAKNENGRRLLSQPATIGFNVQPRGDDTAPRRVAESSDLLSALGESR